MKLLPWVFLILIGWMCVIKGFNQAAIALFAVCLVDAINDTVKRNASSKQQKK